MDKKTIYIKTDFTVKFGASGQLADLINGAIMDAYSTSAGIQYVELTKSILANTDISSVIISSINTDSLVYEKVDYFFDIKPLPPPQNNPIGINYTWTVKGTLTSKDYELIAFCADKTIVCTLKGDNEVLFLEKPKNGKVYLK
ncbi:MAG: hypothetical protein KBH03_06230 [Paludibacteraceae bacterium]|nr:hypothetical protein [Paludibacteraceae bacterium]